VWAHESGHRLSITTKSDLVVRDLELLQRVQQHNHLRLHITVTTLDPTLARLLEPGAPTPRTRISTMKTLTQAGIEVDAFVMPILPGLTDGEKDLDTLFEVLAEVGVRTVVCDALFLRSPSKEVFFQFLRQELPEKEEEYRRRYDTSVYASPLYVEQLRARVERLRCRWNLLGAPRAASYRAEGGTASGEGSRVVLGRSPRIRIWQVPLRRTPSLPKRSPPRSHGVAQLRLFE
ncbi:MAG: radical SAM protein, partial [Planctomycetota bacterium]